MQVYPRPTEKHVDVPREDVEGDVPRVRRGRRSGVSGALRRRLVGRDQVPELPVLGRARAAARCSAAIQLLIDAA